MCGNFTPRESDLELSKTCLWPELARNKLDHAELVQAEF